MEYGFGYLITYTIFYLLKGDHRAWDFWVGARDAQLQLLQGIFGSFPKLGDPNINTVKGLGNRV